MSLQDKTEAYLLPLLQCIFSFQSRSHCSVCVRQQTVSTLFSSLGFSNISDLNRKQRKSGVV